MSDLVADEAVYHTECHIKLFSSNRALSSNDAKGRKESTTKQVAFERMCDWLDKENELHTLQDLLGKMMEDTGGTDVYGKSRN